MKIRGQKSGSGHITAYNAVLGSKEVRDAGFLNEDGTSKILKKTVDPEKHTILIEIDPDANQQDAK